MMHGRGRSVGLRRGLHRDLVDALGRRIVGGDPAPGQSFPNEADLGVELDVSRTALREAIKVLAAKGLVDVRPKTGTRVLPRSHWNLIDPDVMHWRFEDGTSEWLLRELTEVRMIVEPAAARLAAIRRTEDDLERIEEQLQAMLCAGNDAEAFIEADVEFHSAIVRGAHNELLTQMAGTIHEALVSSRRVTVRVPGGPAKAGKLHGEVAQAIRVGDGNSAARAMERHVQESLEEVEKVLHSNPSAFR